jgi:hypothetical protein
LPSLRAKSLFLGLDSRTQLQQKIGSKDNQRLRSEASAEWRIPKRSKFRHSYPEATRFWGCVPEAGLEPFHFSGTSMIHISFQLHDKTILYKQQSMAII